MGYYSLQSASVYSLEAHSASSSAFGFEFLVGMKRLHSHTQLVRLQQYLLYYSPRENTLLTDTRTPAKQPNLHHDYQHYFQEHIALA
ncbi:hypothetical protein ACN42_g10920 [Penicillium freii]|uniref:Uncharacterized protein n=1 Tax=Penicillium freii TaxID=48697 RepID=A0A101M944_PENFR|nr:hypothetical protein ACN42_g10920 [Penicillium freii]